MTLWKAFGVAVFLVLVTMAFQPSSGTLVAASF